MVLLHLATAYSIPVACKCDFEKQLKCLRLLAIRLLWNMLTIIISGDQYLGLTYSLVVRTCCGQQTSKCSALNYCNISLQNILVVVIDKTSNAHASLISLSQSLNMFTFKFIVMLFLSPINFEAYMFLLIAKLV